MQANRIHRAAAALWATESSVRPAQIPTFVSFASFGEIFVSFLRPEICC